MEITSVGRRGFASWHATRRSITFGPKDVSGRPDWLFSTLPASKADPFHQGFTTTTAAAGDRACAISALHLLLERWPSPPETTLFTLHHPSVAAFDHRIVVSGLRGCLVAAGISGTYSGLRRRAATSARRAGVADHDIQLLGRWRSDAYKRYIEAHPEYAYNASRRLQSPNPASCQSAQSHNPACRATPKNPPHPPSPNTPARPPPPLGLPLGPPPQGFEVAI